MNLARLARELGYIAERARSAAEQVGETRVLARVLTAAEDAIERANANDLTLLEGWQVPEDPGIRDDFLDAAGLRPAHVAINRALQGDRDLLVTFAEPWTRHEATWLPPSVPELEYELVALRGEMAAAAFTLSNAADTAIDCEITVEGLPADDFALSLRRQVYLETWYQRAESGIYDAMPLVPGDPDSGWSVSVPPGGSVRLHLAIDIGAEARETRGSIIVRAGDDQQSLDLAMNVLPATPPALEPLQYCSFVYPPLNVGGHHPRQAARHMGSLARTIMEFPYMPEATWTEDGALVEADFSRYDQWMDDWGPHIERMMIYWVGDIEIDEDTTLVQHSPEWRRAYIEILQAWLEHAAERGYAIDRFCALVVDELHSASLDASPDQHVLDSAETMRQVKAAIPDLDLLQTLTYYAFPADVEQMAPYIDIAVIARPWPEQLTRNAPPTYNPRRAWDEQIEPLLQARMAEGMELLSYHVASGKSDDLLRWNHAYPILMLAEGMTGVGHWAYNVARASTWHDWDGTGAVRLDYSFIYDGTEANARNERFNPTGEVIVPSIRWEALREGYQVAHLLVWLRRRQADVELGGERSAAIDDLWSSVADLATAEDLSVAEINTLADRTRRLWADVAPE